MIKAPIVNRIATWIVSRTYISTIGRILISGKQKLTCIDVSREFKRPLMKTQSLAYSSKI